MELRQAMEGLFTLTDCEDPEQPDGQCNLLAQYTEDWRRDRIGRRHRHLGEREQAGITDAVIEAATQLSREARRRAGIDQ